MKILTVCMESKSSLNWWGLMRVFFWNLYHLFHALWGHKDSIKSKECIFHCFSEIFSRLIFRLLLQLCLKVPFTEFGALKTSMAIKNSEKPNTLIELRIWNMCVLLKSRNVLEYNMSQIETNHIRYINTFLMLHQRWMISCFGQRNMNLPY